MCFNHSATCFQAREKQLQQEVTSLQQLIKDLRLDLNNAKKHNEDLQKRLTEMVPVMARSLK